MDRLAYVLKKVDSMKLPEAEVKLFLAILVRINENGFCETPNNVLAQHLGVVERSISKWTTSLAEKKVINVVQNRHKHRRQIYINGLTFTSKRYVEPALEDMSPAQRMFKEAFPHKEVDCEVPDGIDMEKLIEKIRESTFVREEAQNMNLKSCVYKNYKKIIAGEYRDRKKKEESKVLRFAKDYGVV